MNAFRTIFSRLSATAPRNSKHILAVCKGVQIDPRDQLVLGDSAPGCFLTNVPIFRPNRPQIVGRDVAIDIFILHTEGGPCIARPNKYSRNCLVHISTKVGDFDVSAGGTQAIGGLVKKHAQGFGKTGRSGVTYEDVIVEIGVDSMVKVTGTDGVEWSLVWDGTNLLKEEWREMPAPDTHKTEIVPRQPNTHTALGKVFSEAVAA